MSRLSLSRRALIGGAVAGGTGAVVGGALTPSAAFAAPTAWRVFFVEHPGGTPDQGAIQTALAEAAGGGHVVVGPGMWSLTSPLLVRANTRLTLSPATTIRRTGAVNAMLRNGTSADTTTTGHNGPGNILVEGGVWDANEANVPAPGWGFVFAHTRHITIRDLEIRNVSEWHAIELNSTYNALVENCRFVGARERASAVWNQEAVSVDLAAESLVPWGAADNTQSSLIRVVNNYCENWPTFFGSHTGLSTSGHELFVVAANTVRDLAYWAVSLRNASRAVITGNTVANVGGGIWIRPHEGAPNRPLTSVVIADNVIDGTNRDEGIRVTGVNDTTNGDGKVYCTSITGNVVRRAKTTGIRVAWAPEVRISDNSVYVAGTRGLSVSDSEGAVVSGNYLRGSQHEGLAVERAQNHQVTGNSVVSPCRATDASRDAMLFTGVTNACVQTNKVTSAVPRPRHAIAADPTSAGLFVTNNDLRDGWQTTALGLAGTGHITSTQGNLTA